MNRLNELPAGTPAPGRITLVGAGPGDPDLLTLKAVKAIQAASVILVDDLVGEGVMAHARPEARVTYVGKRGGCKSTPQATIEQLMLEAVRAGENVVRLKGGDPFVFGRGGEEMDAVEAAGIAAFIVPGISSALGCAASAGIPLTHRDHAQSLTLVTGHAKEGGVPDLDWTALAKRGQTVAVYMGVGTAAMIADRLIEAGRAPETPVAVIENGTLDNEVTVTGLLENLPHLIEDHGIRGPALLIIGEVAGLRSRSAAALLPNEVVAA